MDEYIGTIKMFAGNFAPYPDYLLCLGQQLNIQNYAALYSVIGTTYGGDGRTYFNLPNLQSRIPLGYGQGPGLSLYNLGEAGGVEAVTLSQMEMPQHIHPIAGTTLAGNIKIRTSDSTADSYAAFNNAIAQAAAKFTPSSPNTERPQVFSATPTFAENNYLHASTVDTSGFSVSGPSATAIAGGSQPHENRQPFLTVNFIICVNGLYPSRP